MRPLSITIEAFGPYAGRQSVSFEELGASGLFLICGPTGAGKSTILDAICFALYGDTSGNERSGRQMRSDHSGPAAVTEVSFDFQLGAELFRVTRRPEYERPKKKGEGTTTVPAGASLWKRTGLSDPHEEGKLLAEGAQKVTAKIEELFGFRSDQFRQVIMIPQGQFRKLLLASSVDREDILKRLFRTEFYALIETRLRERSAELKKQLELREARRQAVLQAAGVENEDRLSEELELLRDREGAARKAYAAARDEERRAAAELAEAARAAERFREFEQAAGALESILARKNEAERASETLARAERAAGARDAEEALLQRESEAARAANAVGTARSRLAAAEAAKSRTEAEHAESEREAEKLPALRERLLELQSLRGKLVQLAEAAQAVSRTRGELELKLRTAGELSALKAQFERELEEAVRRSTDAANGARLVEPLTLTVRTLTQRLEAMRALSAAAGNSAEWMKRAAVAAEAESAAGERLEAAKRVVSELQERVLKDRAAALAAELTPGRPCPVCGSTEHPAPAQPGEPVPDGSGLEVAAEEVLRLERELSDARRNREAAERELAAHRAREEALREHALTDRDLTEEELRAQLSRAKDELETARRAAEAGAKAADKAAAIERRLSDTAARLSPAEQEAKAAERDLSHCLSVMSEREAGIPEEFRDPDTLERGIVRFESEVRRCEKRLEETRAARARAGETAAAAAAELEAADAAAAESADRRDRQRSAFLARLAEAGFADEAEYADAGRNAAEIAALKKEVEAYRVGLEAARERAARAKAAVSGLTAPDLSAMETKVASARERADELQKQIERTVSRKEELARRLSEAGALTAELERLEAEYRVYQGLYEAASGKTGDRVTFQRFVLGSLLDDVLASASERLRIMSRGRFALQRQAGSENRARSGGLDLEVYDSYTGTVRPAATLSGGESFLASLSLALGMADVVQAYAGGIRLDTIFIDEGFGSLDPEALEAAMQALTDLRKAGRLVGIISHVPELRERIGARIEVIAGKSGSRVSVTAG